MWVFSILLLAVGPRFADVPNGHWAYNAVTNVTVAGYMHGDLSGAFRGDKPVTRYEFAVALDRFVRNVKAGLAAAPKPFVRKSGGKPAPNKGVLPPKPRAPKKPPDKASGSGVAGTTSPLTPGSKRVTPMAAPPSPHLNTAANPVQAVDPAVGVSRKHWAYKPLRRLLDGKYLPPDSPIFSAATATLTARQVGLALGQIAVRLADLRSDQKEPRDE
jgi:hypothetical protein